MAGDQIGSRFQTQPTVYLPADLKKLGQIRLQEVVIHASWLNQIEIYFSILQRKVLTPNDFPSLSALSQRLYDFERHYERKARPFKWKFTRRDLDALLERLGKAA